MESLPERLEALMHYRKEKLVAQRAEKEAAKMELVWASSPHKTHTTHSHALARPPYTIKEPEHLIHPLLCDFDANRCTR